MADKSGIEWTDSSLSLWFGCTQLTAACDYCYAKALAGRLQVEWNGPPRIAAPSAWAKIELFQRGARRFMAKHGRQRRVFINHLSDIGDNQAPAQWCYDACVRMEAAPDVVWILVTKRPENLRKRVPPKWMRPGGWPANVWVLVTTETQKDFDHRVPLLWDLPAPVRGISAEPLLEEIDWAWAFQHSAVDVAREFQRRFPNRRMPLHVRALDWAIMGGESGSHARPMPPMPIVLKMADQVEMSRAALFFKQLSQFDHKKTFRDHDAFPHRLQYREHPAHVRP